MNNYTEINSWIIYWHNYMQEAYLYGSKVLFHAFDDVEFQNDLIPPSSIIKSWFSKTKYQKDRYEPKLPLIKENGLYRIEVNVEEIEPTEMSGLILGIIFYNCFDEEIDKIYINNYESIFMVPKRTYSYEVQLISAGCVHFHFHNITISLIEKED